MAFSGKPIEPWEGTGWPLTLFGNQQSLQDENLYFCSRSDCGTRRMRIVREPWQLNCGHRICKDCLILISDLPQEERICDSCPGDDDVFVAPLAGAAANVLPSTSTAGDAVTGESSMEVDEAFKDDAAHRAINQMAVICPYRCNTTGLTIKLLMEHMNECEERLLNCLKCAQRIIYSQRDEHVRVHCPRRPVQCPYKCGKSGLQSQNLMKHMVTCGMKPTICEFCMEEYANDFKEHMCSCSGKCPFKCGKEGEVNIESHLGDYEYFPIHVIKVREMFEEIKHAPKDGQVTIPFVTKFLGQLLDIECRAAKIEEQLKGQVDQLTKQSAVKLMGNLELVEGNRNLLDNADKLFNNITDEISRMNTYRIALDHFDEQLSQKEEKIPGAINRLQAMHRVRDAEIDDHKKLLPAMEMASYTGNFLWYIDDVDKYSKDERLNHSLYSPPFFTHVYGYKMCARIYFNGDGTGKGTHVSVYFVIMKGEFDALLPWPFRQLVTISLKNQIKGKPDISRTFISDSSSSFNRPELDMNIAIGIPGFAEQSAAYGPDNGYLVDNAMFIHVYVDDSHISGHSLPPPVMKI